MPDAIVEKLWKIVGCRDQSLNAVHESLATQVVEKERQINRMALALTEKEQEIVRLASALSEREDEILRKEVEIGRLAVAASERLELIDRQHAELESISSSMNQIPRNDPQKSTRTCNPFVVWFTGLSASGKTTLASLLQAELAMSGVRCFVLDGDLLRGGLCSDLGFSAEDRAENLRRAGEVARLLVDAGLVVIAAFISPYAADRSRVRSRFRTNQFCEVFLQCPIEVCRQRDPKGLYRKAQEGLITAFTGVSDPYEPPLAPDLVIRTGELTIQESLRALHRFCVDRCLASESAQ